MPASSRPTNFAAGINRWPVHAQRGHRYGVVDGQRTGRLVAAHYEGLYRYAYRLCGGGTDAEDLTQEAFCKAQANLAQLRDLERAKPWLFSILRNAYLHRTRADRNPRFVSLDAAADVAEPPADPLPEIEPDQLQKALDELPEVFGRGDLYYFEDFSYRDIAEQMDLPLGTVMSRLARPRPTCEPGCCSRIPPVWPRPNGGRTMDCSNARLPCLPSPVPNGLPHPEAAELRHHLDSCTECAATPPPNAAPTTISAAPSATFPYPPG
jgi:RNA polymerase sigma-70 factor (ECF subfamily)